MDISIVICTYNRFQDLCKTLSSIELLKIARDITWEVLIIDNNSSDLSKSIICRFVEKKPYLFKYIFEEQQGKSFALNKGIEVAKGEIIAFTDDDVIIDPHWVSELGRAFDTYQCMAVGGKTIPTWSRKKPSWYAEDGPFKLRGPIVEYNLGDEFCKIDRPPCPFGANMAFKKVVFEKYGLFRTDLGRNPENLTGGEDHEFCMRLLKAQESFIYSPKAIVYHPVTKERIKKRYFLSWFFGVGRSDIRIKGISSKSFSYFGVPRWYFRRFFKWLFKWLFSFNLQERFYYKAHVYRLAGEIVETLNTYKQQQRM
jgi:glucosyl-dolichyl phosphate glucuronosyltransferase